MLVALARRQAPVHPGAARVGQDLDIGASDRAPARARQARRRRLDEPQGDPQPARRGRAAAARGGLGFGGLKKASGGNPESLYRELATSRASTDASACIDVRRSPPAPPGSSRGAEHDGTLDYLFIDEAGQVSLADALAIGTPRGTSCSSATRSSSTR